MYKKDIYLLRLKFYQDKDKSGSLKMKAVPGFVMRYQTNKRMSFYKILIR